MILLPKAWGLQVGPWRKWGPLQDFRGKGPTEARELVLQAVRRAKTGEEPSQLFRPKMMALGQR